MVKFIIIAAVVIIIFFVIVGIIDELTKPKRKKLSRPSRPASPPAAPEVQWNDTPQRQAAARNAATQMAATRMNNANSEAVQIRRIVHQRNISINTDVLNTAQNKIIRICNHAEKIRGDVQTYRNNPRYLQDLYRTGVGISNEAHELRVQISSMQDTLYRMSRSNASLKPLYQQVRAFCNSVYSDEVELNNRNRILRTYIGNNFGQKERAWNNSIEERARTRRASGI